MLTTFRVRTTMMVPREFVAADTMARSNEFVPMVLDNLVSLRPGQAYVEIQTTVDNTADDHRVRVLFPSGTKTDTFLTDTAFDVVERPIALPKDNHEYRELNVEAQPQQSWTAVHDAKSGLAVIADGLLETAVGDTTERPIALTLFRGFRRTVFTNGEPDGQTRGPMTFRYLVMPLAGKPDRTQLCELGQRLAAGLRAVQLRREDVDIFKTAQTLPPTAGSLRVEGPAVVTSLRQVGAATELRLFNPTTKAISATIHFAGKTGRSKPPATAQRVDFESNPLGQLAVTDGKCKVTLKPKQIVTVRLG